MKILINDGIADAAIKLLEAEGFEVDTNKIPQEELMTRLQDYVAICVRSATKVRKELIEACPGLKAIGRGGVGLDNIDVDYARSKGIYVLNTPAASSRSVAELAFAHMLSIARSVHDSNRKMPVSGSSEFKNLKKAYSKGIELEGKTLGVIGLGRIGQETVRIGLGMGMNIVGVDPYVNTVNVRLGGRMYGMDVEIKSQDMDTLLADADFISIHVPSLDKPIISSAEISKMKDGAVIVNCSRGGIIDEDALLAALDSGKLMGAGLDVFVGEPSPREDVLQHPGLTLTPHTGASTLEAQDKIGIELAEKLISVLK